MSSCACAGEKSWAGRPALSKKVVGQVELFEFGPPPCTLIHFFLSAPSTILFTPTCRRKCYMAVWNKILLKSHSCQISPPPHAQGIGTIFNLITDSDSPCNWHSIELSTTFVPHREHSTVFFCYTPLRGITVTTGTLVHWYQVSWCR